MKLGFEETQAAYTSGSQSARVWTESWVRSWAYCPHCGDAKLHSFPNNSKLADASVRQDSHRAEWGHPPEDIVLEDWQRTLFLRKESPETR